MIDVVRAWKDEEYRSSLTEDQRSTLPAHPAAEVEVSAEAVGDVRGGEMGTQHAMTLGCCGGFTTDPDYCTLGGGSCSTAPSTWTNACMTSGLT